MKSRTCNRVGETGRMAPRAGSLNQSRRLCLFSFVSFLSVIIVFRCDMIGCHPNQIQSLFGSFSIVLLVVLERLNLDLDDGESPSHLKHDAARRPFPFFLTTQNKVSKFFKATRQEKTTQIDTSTKRYSSVAWQALPEELQSNIFSYIIMTFRRCVNVADEGVRDEIGIHPLPSSSRKYASILSGPKRPTFQTRSRKPPDAANDRDCYHNAIPSISSPSKLPIPTSGYHRWPNQDFFLLKSHFPTGCTLFLIFNLIVSKPSIIEFPRRVFRAYKPRVLQSLIIYHQHGAVSGKEHRLDRLSLDTKSTRWTREGRHTSSESKDKGEKVTRQAFANNPDEYLDMLRLRLNSRDQVSKWMRVERRAG
ncbi:hypothetical protein OG21DRAFT_703641 [Imleria badia]|nr:hypothetical protein OG21DRAFT_703641 [Imleria badia]